MQVDRELVDFHHRIWGIKAMRKVFLDDLDGKLWGQFFGKLPSCFRRRGIGWRIDHAIGVDCDDDRSITGR